MTDEVLLNKVASMERCIKRIQEEYHGHETEFLTNYTKQDAIILNLQRACEISIDAAMHIVQVKALGLPQGSRDAFVLLEESKIISPSLSQQLQSMVGFRNIAVHEYTRLDPSIVISVIEKHLGDFLAFSRILLELSKK